MTGCTQVSPGCAHCYAKTFAERWRGVPGHHYEQGFDLRLWDRCLEQPLRWRAPRTIFVNSMSDLFHDGISFDYIGRVFEVMATATQHSFRVLTKRHERLAELATQLDWPPNVWMGVSVENRRFVNRADYLREVPAAVRFISAEPLLGPLVGLNIDGIDWLIAGGESGHRHRPSASSGYGTSGTAVRLRMLPFSSSSGAAALQRRAGATSTVGPGTSCPRGTLGARLALSRPCRQVGRVSRRSHDPVSTACSEEETSAKCKIDPAQRAVAVRPQ